MWRAELIIFKVLSNGTFIAILFKLYKCLTFFVEQSVSEEERLGLASVYLVSGSDVDLTEKG